MNLENVCGGGGVREKLENIFNKTIPRYTKKRVSKHPVGGIVICFWYPYVFICFPRFLMYYIISLVKKHTILHKETLFLTYLGVFLRLVSKVLRASSTSFINAPCICGGK